MSKYIKLEDAIKEFNYGTDYPVNTIIDILYDLTTIEVSEDCISREWVKGICEAMLDEEMLGHMLGHIEDAPSVVPKRAEGEWIKQFNGTKCVCSICGYSNGRKHNDNYCPNCGAKMKGVGVERDS